jgi:uncharacterized membrane protein
MDTPEMIAAEYLRRNVEIDIGTAVKRGWELVMANMNVLVVATVLTWAINAGLSFIPVIRWGGGVIIGSVLHAGLMLMFIRRIRGERVELGDLFAGFNFAVPLIIAGLLMSALTLVGFVLCILPGVYLAVGYVFALPLIIDKKLDFWPAMEVSRQVVTRHWWSMFLFAIVLLLIICLGALACGFGLILAVPVVFAALSFVYEDLFGTKAAAPAQVTP